MSIEFAHALRYFFERYGSPFGFMSMQGGEKMNDPIRADLGPKGNNNNHYSMTNVSTML